MRRASIASLFLILLTMFVYGGVLFAHGPDRYLWGSDAFGHVLKAEYLQQSIAQGQVYPNMQPAWYMGAQLLRYYPPLPYYLLAGLTALLNDGMIAARLFTALCALVGSLTWLLYHRWLGWFAATAGGVIFVLLPDNLRVSMAEGNLPRVLATVFLPLAFYLALRSLEPAGSARHRVGLALCFAAIVLSHAMMAAIYAVCCTLLVALYWLGGLTSARRAALTIAAAALGIGLCGWWLLPSLTGGITELNANSMTEALAVLPLENYLNPTIRTGNGEAVYVGAVLLVLSVVLLLVRHGRSRPAVALTVVGLFGVLITTPGFNTFFNSLPLHQLLWPLRFLGVASFCLLLAALWRLPALLQRWPVLTIAMLALVLLDGLGSLPLIHLRSIQPDVQAIGKRLAALGGWRVATLDESRLGSAPAYLFSAAGGREQIYGWAYQGARTARNVAALNEAMETSATAYLRDRLTLFGVDDVALLQNLPAAPGIAAALVADGYREDYVGDDVSLYHRDGAPRAYHAEWRALGIGPGAQNIAYLFPQLIVGTSPRVDDYTLAELRHYQTLVLSGFAWRDRDAAEQLVRQAAAAGVLVIVDLTGAPEEPLARRPRFLDVWGEQLIIDGRPIHAAGAGGSYDLQPLGGSGALWYTNTPQGLDATTLSFDYLGENATILGYKSFGVDRVWFLGLNVAYHAASTRDPAAIGMLADLLRLPADTPSQYQAVQLQHYAADQSGYRFDYTLSAADTLILPVANHDGTRVTIDGAPAITHSFERLVAFDAPAGAHTVMIGFRSPPIYLAGKVVSILSLLAVLVVLLPGWRAAAGRRLFPPSLVPNSTDLAGTPGTEAT